jgi:cell division septum initiation protein DivIVA
VTYLEGRLATTQADLDGARSRIAAYAEADRSLNEARAGTYRSADEIRRRAQADADQTLRAAVDERQMLASEARRLREERDALRGEISSVREDEVFAVRPTIEPASPRSLDLGTAVMEEMRSLLLEIMRDARARSVGAPVIAEQPVARSEVATEAVLEIPIIEHVDDLVRSPTSGPIEDEDVEELRA